MNRIVIQLHLVTEDDWPSHRELRLGMLAEMPEALWASLADVADRTEAQWREATRAVRHLQARDTSGTPLGTAGLGAVLRERCVARASWSDQPGRLRVPRRRPAGHRPIPRRRRSSPGR